MSSRHDPRKLRPEKHSGVRWFWRAYFAAHINQKNRGIVVQPIGSSWGNQPGLRSYVWTLPVRDGCGLCVGAYS